ncbi:hypothetical protein ONA70_10105 [Micromonospora yasonensis]|uniref:hypothetical protein n=1 Tax=Micromonospora yasonensis TaxID=1128667 RepID=UPI00223098E3|nr:hypothetical protein [Micromonospora yasonensis]MCW3840446.1 hypothetical protein [Micromonospora yasonensis]
MHVVLTQQAWEPCRLHRRSSAGRGTDERHGNHPAGRGPAAVETTLMAADAGLWEQVVAMAAALTEFLHLRSCWAGLEAVYLRVRAAAEATGNRDWMAAALYNLAQAAEKTGFDGSRTDLRASNDGQPDPLLCFLDEHAFAVAVVWQHRVVQFFVADLHSATGPADEDVEYGAQVDVAEVAHGGCLRKSCCSV